MKYTKLGITLIVLVLFSTSNATEPKLPTNILAIGDSHTQVTFLGNADPRLSWPEHLETRIRLDTDAINAVVENIGIRGYSTANMLRNLKSLDLGVYDTAIIYGGANDSNAPREVETIEDGTRLTLSTPDENDEKNRRYEQGSHVIIRNTVTGDEYVRHLTGVGGQPTVRLFLSEPVPVIDDFGDYEVRMDTSRNLSQMARILRANGVDRIAIVGAHLRAFSPGGEPFDCGSQRVEELGIQASTREAQKLAAENSGARFVDTLDQNLGLVCNVNPNPEELVSNPQSLHRVTGQGIPDSHLTVDGRRLFLAIPIFSAMRQEGWL